MRITKLFTDFFESERAGGYVLIASTLLSLYLANTSSGQSYIHFWHQIVGGMSIEHWVNDGLMAIFFLLIGLELEREIYIGELSNFKEATLPIMAAIGGMAVPALIYFLLNKGTPTQSGIGIPMATDIAFALGILSLLGNRIPYELKVFLTALAVIDDLGAILIIAIFYSENLQWNYLLVCLIVIAALWVLNRRKVYHLIPYLVGGVIMWYCMLKSGIHASITGVVLAFLIPFGNGKKNSISFQLQNALHNPVAFFIIPVFALANTAFVIYGVGGGFLSEVSNLGIILGLVLGKPIGITLFAYLCIKLGWSRMLPNVRWKQLWGVACLGGIGFTMSIFIAILAYEDISVINQAKLSILLASCLSGILGYLILKNVKGDSTIKID